MKHLLFCLLAPMIATLCSAADAPRIAVLRFHHETVTFLPNETTLQDFIYPGSPAAGEELLRADPKGEIGGFVKVAREYGAELVGIESPGAPKTGIGSSWIQRDAYEHFVGIMLKQLAEKGPFDGVYLSLHGAMAVHGIPRPEAELAQRVRKVVGPKTMIVGTFDPHGNEDESFLKHANLAFCYKYYPHYDTYLQGERAARTLIRAIRSDYQPTTVTRQVPILSATVYQWTGQHPWSTLVQRCLTWEAREPDVYINFFYGFPWADVPDAGMCFQVITNNNPSLAEKIAEDLRNKAWEWRKQLFTATPIHPVKDAVRMAKDAVAKESGSAIIADYSDRSGNATWVLKEVVDQNVEHTLIATIRDAKLLAALSKTATKVSDPFDGEVGGYMDESAGKPVRIRGKIASLKMDSAGKVTAVAIQFGKDNLVMISPELVQYMTPEDIAADGIEHSRYRIIVLKSRVHFRRGFEDTGYARTIVLAEPPVPSMGTVHLDALKYQNLNVRDFFPYSERK